MPVGVGADVALWETSLSRQYVASFYITFMLLSGSVLVPPVSEADERSSFFGEIALLYRLKRTATVRALTYMYCHVFVLHTSKFESVLEDYPEVERELRIEANKRFEALFALQVCENCSEYHVVNLGDADHVTRGRIKAPPM